MSDSQPNPDGGDRAQPTEQDMRRLRALSVLVVAGSESNRQVLVKCLAKHSIRAGAVGSASAALHGLAKELHTDHPFNMLIIDLADGIELVESIRNDQSIDPVLVALTSGSKRLETIKYERLGVDCLLTKPIRESELISALIEACKRYADKKIPMQERVDRMHSQSAVQAAKEPAEPSAADQGDDAKHILLVEDGDVDQKFAETMLSRWGYQVTIANNGKEAINLIESGLCEFDMVLMDLIMPEMDGMETTIAIRKMEEESGQHVPIIAITARQGEDDRQQCLDAGMDGYLTKPLRRRELQETLDELAKN